MSRTILIVLAVFALAPVGQRPPVKCAEDSPERRGEEGCTILTSRPLVGSLAKPAYWHIDRFDSLEAAKKAAGPDGVAFIESAPLSDEERAQVAHRNSERIFRIAA